MEWLARYFGLLIGCRRRHRWRSRRDLRLFSLPEKAIDEPRAAGARVPAHTQDDDLHRPPAQCERFVTAPHVDVDVAALDLGAGIHDRVDTVVLLAEPVDLDDRADWQDVRVGGGNAGSDVHPRGGRRALAVGGRGKPQPGARGRRGRRLADLDLPGRVAGIQRGHLIKEGEGDGGRSGRHDLSAGRSRQKHWFDLALGGESTIPTGPLQVKGFRLDTGGGCPGETNENQPISPLR